MEANSFVGISNASKITELELTSALKEQKNIIEYGLQNQVRLKSAVIKIRYTIEPGDCKRLNKQGILKVYNIDEPIEIPVTALLGKWKNAHIGITIFKLNEEWQIEGRQSQCIFSEKKAFVSIVKRLIFKYKPINTLEKLLIKG